MPTVLFAAQPTITGVAQCVLDWTTGLRVRGWDVALACPEDGWLGQRCADAGIPVERWDSVRKPYQGVKRELGQMREIVARTDPDVVFLNGSKAGMIGRLLLRSERPVTFSPHSWSFEASGGVIGWAALQWERQSARWTDAFICVSAAEAENGMAHGIQGRYVVARNGVDTEAIRPVTSEAR
jgi:Glycosyl transferase 4-like domain